MSILDKMKTLFNKGKESGSLNSSPKLKEIMEKTGINADLLKLLTASGNDDFSILKELKKHFLCKKNDLINANTQTENVEIALQIAKTLGYSKIVLNTNQNVMKLLHKSQIDIYNSNSKDFDGLFINEKISSNNIAINEKGDFIFINFSTDNLGKMLNLFYENKEKVIGFSSSSSVLDFNKFFRRNFLTNILKNHKNKAEPVVNEMDLLKKFNNSSNVEINFNEILFSLLKIDELQKSNMLSGALAQFGIKITPEMINALKKQKGIIQSMTENEKNTPRILEGNIQRMSRIAAGSGSSLEEVMKLVSMIDTIRKKGGQFAAQMMNPMAMANNLK